jgi:hypothetical protein
MPQRVGDLFEFAFSFAGQCAFRIAAAIRIVQFDGQSMTQ